MRIANPNVDENGVSKENIFYALDESDKAIGKALLTVSLNPKFSASYPLNIYFTINAEDSVRAKLFGSIMARAYQLCTTAYPMYNARIYTKVNPDDVESLQFYTYAGLQNNDRDEIIQINTPLNMKYNLSYYGFSIQNIPSDTDTDLTMIVNRYNEYLLHPISLETLKKCRSSKNYLAIGMVLNNYCVGEALFYGNDNLATLLGIYVEPAYREKGIGRELIRNGILRLREQGVTSFYTTLQRRSLAQRKLASHCRYKAIKTMNLYPGICIDKNFSVQGMSGNRQEAQNSYY